MAPILETFRLLSLMLSIFTVSAAQPARYRAHPRHLHPARGTEIHSQGVGHTVDLRSTQDDTLPTKAKSKLALRHATLSIFKQTESTEVRRRDFGARQEDNAELLEKIQEVQTAFQSLIGLLAADYGITFGSKSETSSLMAFRPTSTSSPVPGSTVTISTSIEPTFTTTNSAVPSLTEDAISLPTSSVTSSTYSFDPMSSSNVAVYYGQTDQTSSVPLTEVCADPAVDIVVLAFLNNFYTPFPTGPYPTLNMGPNCWASSSAQVSAGASGLIDCVSDGFAELVRTCQNVYGKKIFLCLGGAIGYSDTRIPNDTAANALAGTIWDLFLGGTGLENIRPFGDVVLDGIDIDNENPANAEYLPTLITSLRQKFGDAASTKPYFLSAAPQCLRPDQSIPLESMQTMIDFVWTQFYNDPSCNLGSSGFIASLQGWADDLRDTQEGNFGGIPTSGFFNIGNGVTIPRLLVGTPTFANAGSGFIEDVAFEEIVAQIKSANLGEQFNGASPLGGFMFWDGAYGEESANTDGVGSSYMQIVKDVLGDSS